MFLLYNPFEFKRGLNKKFNLHPRLDLIVFYLSFINITTDAKKCSYIQDSGTNHSNRVHFKKIIYLLFLH